MKKFTILSLYLSLTLFCLESLLAQKHQYNKKEKVPNPLSIKHQIDSTAKASGRILPGVTFGVKTQFPIQHAFNIEINTPARISAYLGLGILSRGYTIFAMETLVANNTNEEVRKQFIQDKLQGTLLIELGTHFHLFKPRDLYFGLNLQFQRFSLPATPQELIENYDFGDSQGFSSNIEETLRDNSLASSFYENSIIRPTIRLMQLGFTIGKNFYFKKNERLSLGVELSYSVNIRQRVKVEADTRIEQLIVDQFISPILSEGTNVSFDNFNIPSLSLRLNYRLGDNIYFEKRKK